MLLVGLTGGIGSGKSTVARKLVERGAVLLDADAITRELQEPGQQVFDEMVAYFGEGILSEDGTLDRAAVADQVFTDPEKKKALEAIVHPAVGGAIASRMAELAETDELVVLDIPLLVEGKGRDDLFGTIVVDLDPAVAVERLLGRGMEREDAERRIGLQATREERRAIADFVIDNSGAEADLEPQVDECWAWMQGLREAQRAEADAAG